MSGIVCGVGVLIAGMAAGASLAWGGGLSAAHSVALDPLLDVHRDVYGARSTLSVTLDGLALLLAIVATVSLREKPRSMPAAGLASLGLVSALVLGALLIEPLAADMASWTAATAPEESSEHLRLLAWLLLGRAALEGLAGLGLVVAIVRDRPVRRAYTSIKSEVDDETAPTVLVPER